MAKELSIKQIIQSEYARCLSDEVYFINRYCYITHPMKGELLFTLYPFQEKTLLSIKEHRYNIILKSRQLGISTLCAAHVLWLCFFFPTKSVSIFATTLDVAKNMIGKIEIMYTKLPDWMKKTNPTVDFNKTSLSFKNGSKIKAMSSSTASGRSEANSLLVIDEAAFIERAEEIWTSAQQTLATGGDCIILSTPNGASGFFHKKWVEAESDVSREGIKFNPIKLKWNVHPDHDQKWRDEQDILLGVKQAAQECVHGDTLVDIKIGGNEKKVKISELCQIIS